MTKDEALHKALKVLNCLNNNRVYETAWVKGAINACEEALEQPKPPEKTTSLKDVIKEFEKDPEMKALLDLARKQVMGMELKQPAQEPVAWMMLNEDGKEITISNSVLLTTQPKWVQDEWLNETTKIPLYTHPHQWQGLTDDVVASIWMHEAVPMNGQDFKRVYRAIEQALKEKNHG